MIVNDGPNAAKCMASYITRRLEHDKIDDQW